MNASLLLPLATEGEQASVMISNIEALEVPVDGGGSTARQRLFCQQRIFPACHGPDLPAPCLQPLLEAQFDYLASLPDGVDRTGATMEAVEGNYPALARALPNNEHPCH